MESIDKETQHFGKWREHKVVREKGLSTSQRQIENKKYFLVSSQTCSSSQAQSKVQC
jgi:hypothetical protein